MDKKNLCYVVFNTVAIISDLFVPCVVFMLIFHKVFSYTFSISTLFFALEFLKFKLDSGDLRKLVLMAGGVARTITSCL